MAMALACSSGAATSVPAPTSTLVPGPTATTAPDPTSTPFALPTELASFRTVEYDPEYSPRSWYGDEYATVGPDGEIYLVEIETGEKRRVTSDGHAKRNPAISAKYLAWIDDRSGAELTDGSRRSTGDIFVLDRASGEERRITESPALRYALRISGNRLVWMDKRNEADGHYTSFDIYAYDLSTDEEIPIAAKPGAQKWPVIDGDMVVWSDNGMSPLAKNPESGHPGCGDCPDNRFDIYAYDFATGEERVLVSNGFLNSAPSISGNHIGWLAFRSQEPRSLKLMNLETGEERTVIHDVRTHYGLSLSDDYVAWVAHWPCDVMPAPDRNTTGAWVQSLVTGETWRVSDYVEPSVALHGNIAFVFERCFGIRRAYAVFLE